MKKNYKLNTILIMTIKIDMKLGVLKTTEKSLSVKKPSTSYLPSVLMTILVIESIKKMDSSPPV